MGTALKLKEEGGRNEGVDVVCGRLGGRNLEGLNDLTPRAQLDDRESQQPSKLDGHVSTDAVDVTVLLRYILLRTLLRKVPSPIARQPTADFPDTPGTGAPGRCVMI